MLSKKKQIRFPFVEKSSFSSNSEKNDFWKTSQAYNLITPKNEPIQDQKQNMENIGIKKQIMYVKQQPFISSFSSNQESKSSSSSSNNNNIEHFKRSQFKYVTPLAKQLDFSTNMVKINQSSSNNFTDESIESNQHQFMSTDNNNNINIGKFQIYPFNHLKGQLIDSNGSIQLMKQYEEQENFNQFAQNRNIQMSDYFEAQSDDQVQFYNESMQYNQGRMIQEIQHQNMTNRNIDEFISRQFPFKEDEEISEQNSQFECQDTQYQEEYEQQIQQISNQQQNSINQNNNCLLNTDKNKQYQICNDLQNQSQFKNQKYFNLNQAENSQRIDIHQLKKINSQEDININYDNKIKFLSQNTLSNHNLNSKGSLKQFKPDDPLQMQKINFYIDSIKNKYKDKRFFNTEKSQYSHNINNKQQLIDEIKLSGNCNDQKTNGPFMSEQINYFKKNDFQGLFQNLTNQQQQEKRINNYKLMKQESIENDKNVPLAIAELQEEYEEENDNIDQVEQVKVLFENMKVQHDETTLNIYKQRQDTHQQQLFENIMFNEDSKTRNKPIQYSVEQQKIQEKVKQICGSISSSSLEFDSINVLPHKKKQKVQLSCQSNQFNSEKEQKSFQQNETYRQNIIAIIENHANQVGLAAYNVQSGHVFMTQIVDRLTYLNTISTINRFYPLEIIFSNTQQNSLLVKILQDQLTQTRFTPVKRNLFDETKGEQIFKKRNKNNGLKLNSLYVSLAALNALVNFIEVSQEIFLLKEHLRIEFLQMDTILVMDPKTAVDLELLIQQQSQSEEGSLISLFQCSTIGGQRLLRSNFLQPLNDISELNKRQFAVTEFTLNKECMMSLKNNLKQFKELETSAVKFIQKVRELDANKIRSYILHIFKLYNFIKKFSSLQIQLNILNLKNDLTTELEQLLNKQQLEKLKDSIRNHLDMNYTDRNNTKTQKYSEMKIQIQQFKYYLKIILFIYDKVYYILKSEKDDLVEIERTKLVSIQTIAQNIYQEYKNKLIGYSQIELKENESRGYYLIIKEGKELTRKINLKDIQDKLDEKMIEVDEKRINKKSQFTFTTQILAELSNRIKETKYLILLYTQKELKNIIEIIQNSLDILFQINSLISQIDICLAFSEFYYSFSSQETPLCMPKLLDTDLNAYFVEGFYHPLLIFNTNNHFKRFQCNITNNDMSLFKDEQLFIKKNDLFITDLNNIQLLIGLENSGKSLAIKSMAIIQIMAQIGCYVPSRNAILSLKNLILSKFYSTDCMEEKQSSFTAEIQQLDFILKSKLEYSDVDKKGGLNKQEKKKDRCIILIDEICNSSAYQDNLSIGFALLEEIAFSFPHSFILCASKNQEYIEMSQAYHNIHSLQINQDSSICDIIPLIKENYDQETQDKQQGKFSRNQQSNLCARLNKYFNMTKQQHLEEYQYAMSNTNSMHFANQTLNRKIIEDLKNKLIEEE